MINVEKTVLVNAGIAQVWDIISNIGDVYKYHPLVSKSPQLSENASGIGAKRRCDFYDGSSVVEEVVGMKLGEELTVKLSEFSLPFKSAQATMRLDKVTDNSTNVSIRMSYKMKYGIFGTILGTFVIKSVMKKVFTKVLKSMNDHATTGKLIGKDGVLLQAA